MTSRNEPLGDKSTPTRTILSHPLFTMTITLYAHTGFGPNPPKVAILLELLKVDYTIKAIPFGKGDNDEGVKGESLTEQCYSPHTTAVLTAAQVPRS